LYNPPLEVIEVQWLIVQYQPVDGHLPIPLGIVILVVRMNTLVFRFREDLNFLNPEDHEVVAGCSRTFASLAVELGATTTFAWMLDTLSNTVCAKGPFELDTPDVEATLIALYRDYCGPIET
jgi:hypothetical protein